MRGCWRGAFGFGSRAACTLGGRARIKSIRPVASKIAAAEAAELRARARTPRHGWCYDSLVEADTSREAHARYAELLRRLAPEQRLRATMGLSRATRELAEAGVRARMPNATEPEVRREVVALLYGEEAATRLFGPREAHGR